MPEVTWNDGKMTTSRTSGGSHTISHETKEHAEEGQTITSGRTPSGVPRDQSQLTDNDVIRVAGGETSVKAAIAAGLVSRNPDGSLTVTRGRSPKGKGNAREARARSAADQQQAQQQEQQGEDHQSEDGGEDVEANMEALDDTTEGVITEAAQKLSPTDVRGAIEDLAKGQYVREEAIGRMASELGIEPDDMQGRVEQVRGAMQEQAMNRMAAHGVADAQEIVNWAWENAPEMMGEAIRTHATQRSTKGYDKVVQAYTEQLDNVAPHALLNAQPGDGIRSIRRADNGKILLTLDDGQEMEYRAAVKAGHIKLSKAKR